MASGTRVEIPVQARQPGKHFSRLNRTQGNVPGVVYGPKTTPVNVLVNEIFIRKFMGRKFESTLFTLSAPEAKAIDKSSVLLRDIQVHPVTRRPVHVDFYAIDMDSKIRVSIGLRFEGKPAGLSDGGVLELILREIEVECKPNEIPDEIVVDVSGLGIGDALHVSDLKVPSTVRVMSLPTLTLATLAVPKEEAATPVAAAATDAAAGAAPAAGGAAAPAAGAAAAPAAGAAKKDDKK